jgi:VIT1/CCC1 family predicted Fe2+/Mn2+ transporter
VTESETTLHAMYAEAIFGSFDGIVSVLGVIAAAYVAGSPARTLVIVAAGLAVAAAVSMAGGQFLASAKNVRNPLIQAFVMGIATLLGAFVPAIPFLFLPKPTAAICTAIIVLLVTGWIVRIRATTQGTLKAFSQTYGILLIAAVISVVTAIVFNIVG